MGYVFFLLGSAHLPIIVVILPVDHPWAHYGPYSLNLNLNSFAFVTNHFIIVVICYLVSSMGIISKPLFDCIMNDKSFSIQFKAWVYAYYYVLTDRFLCEKFLGNVLHFVGADRHPGEWYWNPEELPETMLATDLQYLQFWFAVRHWCSQVLTSNYFKITHDDLGCSDGGIGLVSALDCTAKVLIPHLVGLLEPLNGEQTVLMKEVFKYKSLYENHDNGTFVLYGPASLLNNDTRSPLSFIDRGYTSNSPVHWNVQRAYLDGHLEIVSLTAVRGVRLFTQLSRFVFTEGQQILVNYRDSNYIDLTFSDDEDNNDRVCVTPPSKRPRLERVQLTSILSTRRRNRLCSSAVSTAANSPSSTCGSSSSSSCSVAGSGSGSRSVTFSASSGSFDFGSSSISKSSSGSDSSFVLSL